MSMLAEPRRKQKWSVDPRNSAWSKDDSRFGQKMLERMGWSKGKGLGRSEQGSTDHIRVKLKNDNYGLGANASHEDNWIAHQDDFNELLAQLNNHHGQNASSEPRPEEKKGFSLEEKSKLSRKRVHYTKFTKGKDLSSRTETDLNCIFGKRARPARDQEQESNSCDSRSSDAEETSTPAASELDTESITKTVTSTLTMQEYFAQRMSRLKAARGQAQSPAPTAEETNGTSHPPEEPSPNHSVNGDAEEPKKRKKKKKKSKKATDELEGTMENTSIPSVTEEDGGQQQEHLGKKKKKGKTVENEDGINENCSATSVVEQNCEEPRLSKRKKKHKKHKETEPLNSEEQEFDSEVVHKKNKCRDEVDGVAKDGEQLLRKKCKKDKKKKRQE